MSMDQSLHITPVLHASTRLNNEKMIQEYRAYNDTFRHSFLPWAVTIKQITKKYCEYIADIESFDARLRVLLVS